VDPTSYHRYLASRSRIGLLYRFAWLYPILSWHLKGKSLDVGCGIGDFLRFRRGSVGVDVNPKNIDYCKSRGLDAHIIQPGTPYPFPSSSFDSAILDNVLEHLVDPTETLTEIARVLRPSTHLIVGVPGPKGYGADPDHKHYYDREALASVVQAHGFKHVTTFGLPLPWDGLGDKLSQYCLYGVFRSSDARSYVPSNG
jgi:SAM-dependent methyltransferase